ncbi:F-box protein [Tripterygium wilfordii]|uniref:F-box protein n=1 Tax=Tripterygium wilfordii TaxID=458696 RepID=A0A7J7CU04_TRIWF|nr:putative F-box protein At5g55150 [Tripterygium wilfordii]KAF5737561.1 F-box protein [Tripterygium wilfordii]
MNFFLNQSSNTCPLSTSIAPKQFVHGGTRQQRHSARKTSLSKEAPWLVFPPKEHEEEESEKTSMFTQFMKLEEKRFYTFNNGSAAKEMSSGESFCCVIGSSHGWLVCLDQDFFPSLFNPFNCDQIQLPQIGSSLGIQRIGGSRRKIVSKAVLSSSYPSNEDYYVALIYGQSSKLAFYRKGEDSWTALDSKQEISESYEDIICHENLLYVLDVDAFLQVWDILQCSGPVKKIEIKPDLINRDDTLGSSGADFCFFVTVSYLVKSAGDLLLVVRYIGNFLTRVDKNSVPSYKTSHFEVFKLHIEQQLWIKVGSIGDRALFLGSNESMSVCARDFKMFNRDSIYFTDDNWEDIESNFSGGGHDMGMFSLEDKSVNVPDEYKMEKTKAPPTWLVPHPWKQSIDRK